MLPRLGDAAILLVAILLPWTAYLLAFSLPRVVIVNSALLLDTLDIERGIAGWSLVLAMPIWGKQTATKNRLVETVNSTRHFTQFFIEMSLPISFFIQHKFVSVKLATCLF